MPIQVKLSPRFLRDFKGMSPDISKEVMSCISDLGKDPIPTSRRSHSVTPRGHRPIIYTDDVTSNKHWKMSYIFKNNVIWILRTATHKELDRDPGRSVAREVLATEQ